MAFIEKSQLSYVENFEAYTNNKTFKDMKNKLLEDVKSALIDMWDQLKENTQKAMDQFCLYANQRGLVSVDLDKLAALYNITRNTINKILRALIKKGILVKLHKRSNKHNGKGKPVFLFVSHPYFPMWAKYLGLAVPVQDRAEDRADVLAEKAPIPCDSKEESTFSSSNYIKLNNKQENILNDSLNINAKAASPNKISFIKFVPKALQHFHAFLGAAIKDIYSRIRTVAKKVNITDKKHIIKVANIAMNQLKKCIKEGRSFTLDNMLGYAYTVAYNQFTEANNNVYPPLANDSSKHDNQDNDVKEYRFAYGDNSEQNVLYKEHDNKLYTRTEMTPDWLNKENNTETPKQSVNVTEDFKKAVWDQLNKLNKK